MIQPRNYRQKFLRQREKRVFIINDPFFFYCQRITLRCCNLSFWLMTCFFIKSKNFFKLFRVCFLKNRFFNLKARKNRSICKLFTNILYITKERRYNIYENQNYYSSTVDVYYDTSKTIWYVDMEMHIYYGSTYIDTVQCIYPE